MSTKRGKSTKKKEPKVKEEEIDWSEEAPDSEEEAKITVVVKKTSVADFDRSIVDTFEKKKVSELKIDELLKVLIVRGDKQLNPALSGGAEKLLRQLHREVLRPKKPKTRRSGNRYRGERPPTRSRGRFRGGYGRYNYRRGGPEERHSEYNNRRGGQERMEEGHGGYNNRRRSQESRRSP